MKRPHRFLFALLGIALGLLVAAGWIDGWRRAPREVLPVTGPEVATLERQPAELDLAPGEPGGERRAVAEATALPGSESGEPSAREFLAQWYGDRWPEIQAKIEAASPALDLDMPYHFTPWEVAEAELRRQVAVGEEERAGLIESFLRWTQEPTIAWIRGKFAVPRECELTESDLADIEILVEPMQQEITALAGRFADLEDFYIKQRWQDGDFLRAPFTTYGLSQEMGFHSRGLGGFGWSAVITLTREDYPDMAALEEEIQGVRERRDRRVVDFLRQRFAR